jgi:two-component system chemotaxis response regulator CheY
VANILIVDDSTFDKFVIKKCIERNNHTVIGEASSSPEALKLYQELKPDIVLLDIIMPNDSGIITLGQLMSLDPKANIIMCTSSASQDVVIQASKLGAKYFLAKPITEAILIKTIQKILS